MKSVLNRINNDLYAQKISNRQLSTILDVSHTTTNAMLSNKREFDFVHFVRVLQMLYPNDVNLRRDCLRSFINKTSPKNIRLGMEFLNLYGELDLQNILVEISAKSSNRVNRQLAEIYELLLRRSDETITRRDFHQEVEKKRKEKKITSNELRIVSDFALIYSFLDYKNYQMVLKYTKEVRAYINEIKNKSLAHSFFIRAKEMEATTNHRTNNIEDARVLCKELINDKDNIYIGTIANAYCILAETYTFTDFKIAKMYLERGISLLSNPTNKKLVIRKSVLENTLDFLRLYWGEELDLVKTHHPAELAFLYIKSNRKSEAIAILDKIKRENGSLSPMQEYYMGLATGNKKHFEISIEKFEKTGDFFYISLPKYALK
ncbi:AimR family lysis-lysogeny pheromone receptor [Bacillus sp. PGP15]|uniref:AimR family lysis-lysogeny pheromone receptor n=1 Tax=Bacillus sp. PGP15 TaxID=2933563 RepID=UPI002001D915|nr:AimR family lysis-lysogeny pheromone receptor [Bacillus sp. PGP15]UPL43306.1 AimR family lysis-lysogeny pheromone receptor [Bacillus sp. PGP15]